MRAGHEFVKTDGSLLGQRYAFIEPCCAGRWYAAHARPSSLASRQSWPKRVPIRRGL